MLSVRPSVKATYQPFNSEIETGWEGGGGGGGESDLMVFQESTVCAFVAISMGKKAIHIADMGKTNVPISQ